MRCCCYGDPESGGYLGAPMECLWETPWLDLGKAYMKRDFVLRLYRRRGRERRAD